MGRTKTRAVLVSGRSNNIGGTNILVTKRKNGASIISLEPGRVSVSAEIQSDGRWSVTASWDAPFPLPPLLVGYVIEIQQTLGNSPTWENQQSANDTVSSIVFSNVRDGRYKVRVKAQYSSIDSAWVESPTIDTFVNLSFEFLNVPSFHTLSFWYG
jgi:hypothetical protein